VGHHCVIVDIRRFLSISHTVISRFLRNGEMIVADKFLNPQHFGSDSADVRIRINPEILIRIRNHFWLRYWLWQSLRFLNTSCYYHHHRHHQFIITNGVVVAVVAAAAAAAEGT